MDDCEAAENELESRYVAETLETKSERRGALLN